VIEKYESFEARPLQCAGIVSQKLLDLVSFPSDLVLNRVHVAQIVAPNLEKINMKGDERPVVIDRVGFDTYFGKKAREMGARYYFDEKYESHWAISKGTYKNRALVKTSKRMILCNICVGADGPFSKVAQRFDIKNDYIPAAQARVRYDYDQDMSSMYFHPRWKELFGYIVPEGGNGICRVGIATKKKPNVAFKKFLALLGISQSQIVSRQGGVIPYGFPKEIAFNNTVLIGDSASMVKATTGGGIVMLISAANILAPAIQKSLAMNDFSRGTLAKYYQHKVKRGHIGLSLKIHYFVRLLLARLKKYDFRYFFKIYEETSIKEDIAKYADMDFPIHLAERLLRNKYFIRFLIHLGFRNLNLIPKFIHDIVL